MNVHIKGNRTIVTTKGGAAVLYSYGTPVVVCTKARGHVVTSKKHSHTTSKHINEFLGGFQDSCEFAAQPVLDQLAFNI